MSILGLGHLVVPEDASYVLHSLLKDCDQRRKKKSFPGTHILVGKETQNQDNYVPCLLHTEILLFKEQDTASKATSAAYTSGMFCVSLESGKASGEPRVRESIKTLVGNVKNSSLYLTGVGCLGPYSI